jgi:hypothetical protein
MAEFFDTTAELGSEEEDEDFDEEAGETRKSRTNGANGIEDSSEEEEEDDEEALQAVCAYDMVFLDPTNRTAGGAWFHRRRRR